MGDLEWWSHEQQNEGEGQYEDDDVPDDISIGADMEVEQLKQQKPNSVHQPNYQNKLNIFYSPITKDTYHTTSNPNNNNSTVVSLPPLLVNGNTNHQQQRILTTKTLSKPTTLQLLNSSGNKRLFIDPYEGSSSKRDYKESQKLVTMPSERNNSRISNNKNSRSMTKNEVEVEIDQHSLSSRVKLMNYQGRVSQGDKFSGDEEEDDYDGEQVGENDYDGDNYLSLNEELENNNILDRNIPSQEQQYYIQQQQKQQQFSRNHNFNDIGNNSGSSISIRSSLNARNLKNNKSSDNSIAMITEQPTITAKSKQQQIQQQNMSLNCSDSPSSTIVYGESQQYQAPRRVIQSQLEENIPQVRSGILRRQVIDTRKQDSSRKRYFSILDEQARQQQEFQQEQEQQQYYYDSSNRNDTANSKNSNNYIKSLSPKFKHQYRPRINGSNSKPLNLQKPGIRVNSLPAQRRSTSLRASRQTPLNNRLVVATVGVNKSTVVIKNLNSQRENGNNINRKKAKISSYDPSSDKASGYVELSGLFEEKDYTNMSDSAIEKDNSILEMQIAEINEKLAQPQISNNNNKANSQHPQLQPNQFSQSSPRRYTVASCKTSNPRFYELDIRIGYNKKYQSELQIESDKVTQRAELISDPSYIFNIRQQITSAQKVLADLKIQVKVKEGQKKELEQAMYQIMSRKQISVDIMNIQDIRMRLQGLQMKTQELLGQQAQFNDDAARMKLEMQVKKDQLKELAEMAEKMHIPALKQSESTHRTLNRVSSFTIKIQTVKQLKEKLSIYHRNYASIEKHLRFREEQLQKELHEYKLMVRESTDSEWIFDNAIKSNSNRIEGLMWDAGIDSIGVNEDEDGNYQFSFVMKSLSQRRRELRMEEEEKEKENQAYEKDNKELSQEEVDEEEREVEERGRGDYEENNGNEKQEEDNQKIGESQDNQGFMTQIPVNIIVKEKTTGKQEIPQGVAVINEEEDKNQHEEEEYLSDLEKQQHSVQAFPTIRNSIREEIVGYCRGQEESEELQERAKEVENDDEESQVKEEIVDQEQVGQKNNNPKEEQIVEKQEITTVPGDSVTTKRISKVRISEEPRNQIQQNTTTGNAQVSSKSEPKGEQLKPRRYGPLLPDPFEKENKELNSKDNEVKDAKLETDKNLNEGQSTAQISEFQNIINNNNNNNLTALFPDNLSPQTVTDSPPRLFNLSRKKHNNLNNNIQSPPSQSLQPQQSPTTVEAFKLTVSPKINIRGSAEIIVEQPFDLEKENPSTFVEKQVSDGYHFLGPRERLTRRKHHVVGQKNQEEIVSSQKNISELKHQQISYVPNFQSSEQPNLYSSQSPVSSLKTNAKLTQRGQEEKLSSSFQHPLQKQDLDGTNKDKDIAASFNAAFLQDMYGQRSKQELQSNVTEF